MRLFTGIDLPDEILLTLEDLMAKLRPTARIKWSPAANLHITTRFIGEWPEPRLAELRAVLAGMPRPSAMTVTIAKLGFFPNAHSPRVFFAGVESAPPLAALALGTDQAIEPLGLKPESRLYNPHLTLARIKEAVPLEALREAIAALPSLDFGSFTADRFVLYRSKLTPAGSVYTKIDEFPLPMR